MPRRGAKPGAAKTDPTVDLISFTTVHTFLSSTSQECSKQGEEGWKEGSDCKKVPALWMLTTRTGDAGAKLMSTTDDTGLWSVEEGQSPPYSHSLLDIVLQNREALKGITPDKSPEKHQKAWRHSEPRTKAQMDQT